MSAVSKVSSGIGQDGLIFFALLLAFFVYVTVKGDLPAYACAIGV